mmetsp:Transcript_62326/g.197395  ORF Transcript_62326/g.197395 Transcript_62326/m.197395 type:complete len:111 (-) Transcript_62326:12-344(-)
MRQGAKVLEQLDLESWEVVDREEGASDGGPAIAIAIAGGKGGGGGVAAAPAGMWTGMSPGGGLWGMGASPGTWGRGPVAAGGGGETWEETRVSWGDFSTVAAEAAGRAAR